MKEPEDSKPPQIDFIKSIDGKNNNQTTNNQLNHDEERRGLFYYIKHWLKFHFFLKNRTVEESVRDVINDLATFSGKIVKEEEQEMIKDLLDFYELNVEEIKVPRNEVLALEDGHFEKIFDLLKEKKVSRIPIFRENLDNIIGFVNIKDLFIHFYKYGNFNNSQSLINEMLFVPPSMKALNLLMKMKKSKIHIATIVDEYGGTDGIITINSIISEIVGGIDENAEEKLVHDLEDGTFEVSGRTELEILKDNYNINLLDEEYEEIETLNGLILYIQSEVPEVGSNIKLPNGYSCLIKEVSDRMVLKVIIKNIKS